MSSEMKIIEEKSVDKKTGITTIKKYSRGKLLGSGGFAKCYEVISQETKVVLAGKIIPKTTLTKQR
jgi:polo-like kinase 1